MITEIASLTQALPAPATWLDCVEHVLVYHKETVSALLTFIITTIPAIIALIKHKKSANETLALMLNALKDENKLVDGKFSEEVIKKVSDIGEVLNAGETAIKKVQGIFNSANNEVIKAVAAVDGLYEEAETDPLANAPAVDDKVLPMSLLKPGAPTVEQKVNQAIEDPKIDVKLGSYKGKPIFLTSVINTVSVFKNLFGFFRK